MSDWLHDFFRDVVSPLLFEKDGKHLSPPQIFIKDSIKPFLPATFWIQLSPSFRLPATTLTLLFSTIHAFFCGYRIFL